jgi:hypothetical protein
MGNTYRKERSFDERRSSKKRVAAEVDRKYNKNHRLTDVIYEDDEDIEFEDEYEFEEVQYNRKK